MWVGNAARLASQWRLSKAAGGVKETAETLLVGAVLAVLAAATVFMMVELLKRARVRVRWPSFRLRWPQSLAIIDIPPQSLDTMSSQSLHMRGVLGGCDAVLSLPS
jgi:hypothetical protein